MGRRRAGYFKGKLKSIKRYISIGKETSKSNVQRDFHYICRYKYLGERRRGSNQELSWQHLEA